MVDSKGVLHRSRKDLNPWKMKFVTDRDIHTLADAMKGADMFLGLSVAGAVNQDMLRSMNDHPIVFALANPVPEISYELAKASRGDLIMGTGRSDFPNQVNNVLGFPYIFRGALDVRATAINDSMKLAAAHALAAMESGIARKPITDWDAYRDELNKRIGLSNPLIRQIKARARKNPKRVVFAEAEHYKMLKAAEIVVEEGIAIPILLGDKDVILGLIKEHDLELHDIEIIDPRSDEEKSRRELFASQFHEKRKRRGVNMGAALEMMAHRNFFAPSLVENGFADAMISGLTSNYPTTIRPALRIIGKKPGARIVSGMYIMLTKKGPIFFADATVNMNPDVDKLVEITLQVTDMVRQFNVEPRIAMLSYSNFGSVEGRIPLLVRDAVAKLHQEHPALIVDGDLQANFALNNALLRESFPFSKLVDGPANTLIFPYLTAGNIAYKLVQELGGAEAIGPILMGLNKSIHVLQMGSSVSEIVNMVTIAVIDAQCQNDLVCS
jgi:malate dehydrogenase (oxaloacetate-decarboxylating)(NADP+)